MNKKINDAGLNLVKEFEGLYTKAYKCPAGVWTIGYGHTGKVDGKAICKGMTISKAKATELLQEDMETFERAVNNCSALTFVPNDNQFSALVSFAFNCGSGNLKTLVKNRSAAVVAEKLLLYNKAAGKELNGLTRRRKAERKLFLTPVEGEEKTEKKESIYYDKYTESSPGVDTVLKAVGVPSRYRGDWKKRKPLAAKNGIEKYTGTMNQNLALIRLAKKGKLKKVF